MGPVGPWPAQAFMEEICRIQNSSHCEQTIVCLLLWFCSPCVSEFSFSLHLLFHLSAPEGKV